jgi:lysozyme family protein
MLNVYLIFKILRIENFMYDKDDKVFQKAIKETLGFEGGFVEDKDDLGGATNWGITEEVARKHGYTGEMQDFPQFKAIEIYYQDYWYKSQLHDIAKYDERIALELFDTGVNMGVRTAGKFLQRALNCLNREESLFPNLIVDGIIGSNTVEVLLVLGKQQDKEVLLKMLNVLQGVRYIEICEKREVNKKFVRGWFLRVRL